MDYEKEHIKRIFQLEPAINKLFEDFLWQVAPHLRRINYKGRGIWSKNPAIEKQVDQALREFAAQYKDLLLKYQLDAWERSERKNDETLQKYLKGLGVVLGVNFLLKTFNRVNPKVVLVDLDTVVKLSRNKAARDAFFKNRLDEVISPRVWSLVGQNKSLILNCVSSGILEGKSAAKISLELRKYLKEPNRLFRRVRDPETGKFGPSKAIAKYHPGQGIYRSSFKNAIRLARNETNMAYRSADMARWQQNNFILGYEVKLSGSHPEVDLCDEMQGRYPKTFQFVGWHIQCYCYAVPLLPPEEEFVRHIQNDTLIRGHVKDIPTRANKYVQNKTPKILAMNSKPSWIRDNYKIDGNSIKLNIN